MTSQTGFADVNDTRLYYEIAGSGLPLVFLHGFTLDHRMWDDQFSVFAEQYRVIRYDQRGFGRSSFPTDEIYSHVDDLKALLDFLGIEQTHVVGQSRGGRVSVDFAITHPGAVKRLLLVDPALGGYQWSKAWNEHVKQVWSLGREGDIEGARHIWIDFTLFEPALTNAHARDRLKQMIDDYSGWHWANHDPECNLDPPAAKRLSEINAPTLIVIGELDLQDFHAISTVLAKGIPGARKAVLSGVGHMSNMEAPEGFNRAVLSYLGRIPK